MAVHCTRHHQRLKKEMNKGQNLAMHSQGLDESMTSTPKDNKNEIKHQKEFIKYAMQYGYKIYPSFIFDYQMDQTSEKLKGCRLWLHQCKMIGKVIYSMFCFRQEYHHEIHTFVGKSIILPIIDQPSNELIDKYYGIYKERLTDLQNRHSKEFEEKTELNSNSRDQLVE